KLTFVGIKTVAHFSSMFVEEIHELERRMSIIANLFNQKIGYCGNTILHVLSNPAAKKFFQRTKLGIGSLIFRFPLNSLTVNLRRIGILVEINFQLC
ncbi:hypothetical protein OAG68_01745, partial [bacterium]|nr:hypothetical protein [bacterium]